MNFFRMTILLFITTFLTACDPYAGEAPVRDVNTLKIGKITYYHVQRGETLYSVAWRFEKDYRELASLNHLTPPYTIYAGSYLQLPYSASKSSDATGLYFTPFVKRVEKPAAAVPEQPPYHPPVSSSSFNVHETWQWPTNGKIIKSYSPYNKGIDIAGTFNQPVVAASAGEVVYAGSGIRGYGNMIIIKHSDEYLSAYAYNNRIFVRENENVKAGQQIATLGRAPYEQVALHFEIRQAGKSIDPLRLLKKSRA